MMSLSAIRFGKLILPFIIIMFIISSCGGSGDKLTSDQTEIVRSYQQMKIFGEAGKTKEFMEMRDSVTNEEIRNYFTNWGWILDSAKVVKWTANWPDLAGLPIVQDDKSERWRRILFDRGDFVDTSGREYLVYYVLFLGDNGDVWKVSNVTMMKIKKYLPDGKQIELYEELFPKIFRLPPDFADLRKAPPDENAQPRQRKPNEIKGGRL